MNSKTIREVTLKEDKLAEFVEAYLRSMSLISDNEDVEIIFPGSTPLEVKMVIRKTQEVNLTHYKC